MSRSDCFDKAQREWATCLGCMSTAVRSFVARFFFKMWLAVAFQLQFGVVCGCAKATLSQWKGCDSEEKSVVEISSF